MALSRAYFEVNVKFQDCHNSKSSLSPYNQRVWKVQIEVRNYNYRGKEEGERRSKREIIFTS